MLSESGLLPAAERLETIAPFMPEAETALRQLLGALERDGFRGWDPYDALNAAAISSIARNRLARRLALQTLKHSHVNLRPLLGIRKIDHAKALALALSAYSVLEPSHFDFRWNDTKSRFADRLASLASTTETGIGWGYAFDVETRWGSYKASMPNAVVTSYAAHAFLDAAPSGVTPVVITGALRFAAELAVESQGEMFFSYYSGSRVPIHNANLLMASWVGRSSAEDSSERELARRAVAFTVQRQRPDGSWPYGEGDGLEWVDGFHTAYVIERLVQWQEIEPAVDVAHAISAAVGFFIEKLIDEDGAPRASVLARYPIESHAAGSAITALQAARGYDIRATEMSLRVLSWTLRHLRRSDGRFVFRRGRFLSNRTPYIRWSDCHMLVALAHLVTSERT